MEEHQRIEWIDYAKGIGIVCVMLLHAHVPDPWRRIIYLWVIPLFFFLSGIFAHPERYATMKDFFMKKSMRLILPYLCYNAIAYIAWLLIGRHVGSDAGIAIAWWEPLVGMLRGEYPYIVHNPPLWFICALWSTETVYYLVYRSIRSKTVYGIVTMTMLLIGWGCSFTDVGPLPWEIATVPTMIVFYALGRVWGEVHPAQVSPWVVVGAMLLGVGAMWIGYTMNIDEVRVSNNHYGSYLPFLCGAAGGITALSCLSMLLERVSPHMGWLSYIGRHTYWILGMHLLAYSVVKGMAVYGLRRVWNYDYLAWFETGIGQVVLVVSALLLLTLGERVLNVCKKHLIN